MANHTVIGNASFTYQRGVTYLAVIFAVAIISIASAATALSWSLLAKREREKQLLEIGAAYREAIRRYYESSPGGIRQYPMELRDLLLDPRHLSTRRYLRKLYRDPMSPSKEWGIVVSPQGGIMGVYSTSDITPLKQANFSSANHSFESKHEYSAWKFIWEPKVQAE